MEYYLTTVQLPGQKQIIRDHGDDIWIGLCDLVGVQPFHVSDVADNIPQLRHVKSQTQRRRLVRLVLLNVLAEGTASPDNEPVLERRGQTWYWL